MSYISSFLFLHLVLLELYLLFICFILFTAFLFICLFVCLFVCGVFKINPYMLYRKLFFIWYILFAITITKRRMINDVNINAPSNFATSQLHLVDLAQHKRFIVKFYTQRKLIYHQLILVTSLIKFMNLLISGSGINQKLRYKALQYVFDTRIIWIDPNLVI